MNFRAILAFLAVFGVVEEVTSFCPLVPSRTGRLSPRFLHPNQASDLEARAYELMKEAIEKEAMTQTLNASKIAVNASKFSKDLTSKLQTDPPRTLGPVSWCRKKLWPFKVDEKDVKLP